ncbi:hypothetical protein PROVRETT_07885 [Providencia rettgeri DSM 1131]|nr:hypothetical protein PROVRETT_07885 [Providencia rettgeri DSM 1131]
MDKKSPHSVGLNMLLYTIKYRLKYSWYFKIRKSISKYFKLMAV